MPNLWGLFGMYWMKLTLHRVPIICSSTAMCSLGILWVKQLSSTAVRTGRTLCSLSYAGSVWALADMLSEQWKYTRVFPEQVHLTNNREFRVNWQPPYQLVAPKMPLFQFSLRKPRTC